MTDPDQLLDSRAALVELHVRLSAGDEGAADELCRVLHPKLLADVRCRLCVAEPHEISTAVNDALLRYVRNPALFDPARGALDVWLIKVAFNRARDLRREARRRLAREVTGEIYLSLLAVPDGGPHASDASRRTSVERLLAVARNTEERQFLEARLAGASLAEQAAALGALDLPTATQRLVVYRTVERITRRMRRRRETRRS